MGDKFSDASLKIIQFNSIDEIDMLANNTLAAYLNDPSRYTIID